MALNKTRKVPLPEKGVVKHTNKKAKVTYIYYITRIYRNAKGKPTNDRVSIGKLDESTGLLIPNRNYYEIYLNEKTPENSKIETIKSFGLTFLIDGLLDSLGLTDLLRKKFPKTADKIIAMAQYMLCEGNVMSHFPEWCDEVYPHANVSLTSQEISRIFKEIDYDSRMEFFKTWIYAKEPDEYISYDVTSISSYSKGIESLEWGYNRDGDTLPQINYAMYYGQNSLLPLYYSVYPGSIPDKSHLEYMLRDNKIIGCKKVRYVMDRGFFSADNLQRVTESGNRFIIAVPNSNNFTKELIDKYRNQIIGRSECRLGKDLPYAKSVIRNDFGMRVNAHIYYSSAKATAEENNLFEEIEKCEKALSEMDEAPAKNLRYDRYFKINRGKNGGFGFIRDNKKIDACLSRLGFFVIIETIFTETSLKILETYRERDVIEKSFDNLKNDLDMKRIHCHSNETVEGKMFVAFFALILRSIMRNRLKDYQNEKNLTFSTVLKELNKIKYVKTTDGNMILSPVSKKQREILGACGLDVDNLKNWFNLFCIV